MSCTRSSGLSQIASRRLSSGRVADIADAQAGHAQAVLVGIERAERFAERLAHAVAAVRAHRHVDADALRRADKIRPRDWRRRTPRA